MRLYMLLVLLCILKSIATYKFLGVLPFAAKSHFFIGSSLLKELARRGHEVHVISPFKLSAPLHNYHHIDTPTTIEFLEAVKLNLWKNQKRSVYENAVNLYNTGLTLTDIVMRETEVRNLMNSNHTFDAVIVEVFLHEALYGLSEHFKAPLIGIGPFGAYTWNTDLIGAPSPPSYVPSPFLTFGDHMTLMERIGNQAFITFERLLLDLYYLPRQVAIYKQHFSHLNKTLNEIMRNTALVLLNNHVSLNYARPFMPNMIEVGGMHIDPKPANLSADLNKFIDEAKHGVIYFSMGSNLKSKNLPDDKRNAILETFRNLKQRVLWKFEAPELLKNKPDNLYVSDWFAQNAVLAHPNVKIFITHGGLLSSMESIYFGKPIIGIPIFGDQHLNMQKAVKGGYGLSLDYKTISVPSFTAAIERMLTETHFAQRAKDMSLRFRDQETLPLDRAVFWVEHVVRHKGARYLHCAGQDLNLIQYFNIDAMLILYGLIILIFIAVFMIIFRILRFLKNICTTSNDIQSQALSNKKRK